MEEIEVEDLIYDLAQLIDSGKVPVSTCDNVKRVVWDVLDEETKKRILADLQHWELI